MYLFTIKLDEFILDIVAENAEKALLHIHKRFNIIEPPEILRTEVLDDSEDDEYISKAVSIND
ncbi:hypothetical protein [Staphylococcus phage vB_SsapH-Golestan-100]|nr:hypothetical protein [Staphylococcus phage vB_SsapH-Golestan-100]